MNYQRGAIAVVVFWAGIVMAAVLFWAVIAGLVGLGVYASKVLVIIGAVLFVVIVSAAIFDVESKR